MNIFIYKYNNYYNRMVKREDNLEDYGEPYYTLQDVRDFSPSDGVNTSHLFGALLNPYDGGGDYLIVADENNNIYSRWFIIDISFTREGQWLINLRRDLFVDFYEDIVNSDCYIEKAIVADNDPLIYNQEDFQVNQIKTNEFLLKDKSKCSWLVGYLNRETAIEKIAIKKNNNDLKTEKIGNLVNWEYYPYTNKATNPEKYKNDYSYLTFIIRFHNQRTDETYECYYDYIADRGTFKEYKFTTFNDAVQFNVDKVQTFNFIEAYLRAIFNQISKEDYEKEILPNYIGDITQLQNELIEDSSSIIYSVDVSPKGKTQKETKTFAKGGSLDVSFNTIATQLSGINNSKVTIRYQVVYNEYSLVLAEQKQYQEEFSLATNKIFTEDVYRMICIPFPDEGETFQINGVIGEDGETEIGTIKMTREIAKSIAMGIIQKGGGIDNATLVYDFQLLPYCPIVNNVSWGTLGDRVYIDLQGDPPLYRHYTPVGNIGVVFEVKEPSFTFNIQNPIAITNSKIENQCDMYRLCSPNYAAMFDFNLVKNGGLQYFNVDCHYKPYQPYIHINPNFNGLYGTDFNDARGLILSGDFSLSSIRDAFTNYELNNKNYQLMFDRQVKNIEIQQKYQKLSEAIGVGVGAVQGMATGAYAGNSIGGGVGGAIGGAVGGITSAAAGMADIAINNQLRAESLDYTRDLFGYNLQNIQAQPDALTKVCTFNPNNKIYPILEYYTCTAREKEAFAKKIQYNSMTLGIIDKPINYILNTWSYTTEDGVELKDKGYIKGSIIRLEGLDDDFHLLKSISDEFYKGVYTK